MSSAALPQADRVNVTNALPNLKKRSREPEQDAHNVKRVKSVQLDEVLQQAAEQTGPLPQAVLFIQAARAFLSAAHALSPKLACPTSSQEALYLYRQHVLSAATCLRAALDAASSAPNSKPEHDLIARLELIELLITEAETSTPSASARREVEGLLHKGLLNSQKYAAFRPFYLALVSAQIRFNSLSSPGSAGDKLARAEAKRMVSQVHSDSTDDPYWIYHFLLLHHSLAPTQQSFAALIDLAIKREDYLALAFFQLMRAHWAMGERKWDVAKADLANVATFIAAQDDTKSAPLSQLELQFLALKCIYDAQANASAKAEADIKAGLKKMHGMLDSNAKASAGELTGHITLPLKLSTPTRHSSTPSEEATTSSITLKSIPRPHMYILVFLITSYAYRDPLGKPPKSLLYCEAGIKAASELLSDGPSEGLKGATLAEVNKGQALAIQIKAEMMLVQCSILLMRSKIPEVQALVRSMITYVTKEHPELWSSFRGKLILMQAMLYHALNRTEDALGYYQTLTLPDQKHHELALQAKIGIVFVRLGHGEQIDDGPPKSATKSTADKMGRMKLGTPLGSPAKQAPVIDYRETSLDDLLAEVMAGCSASESPELQIAGSILTATTRKGIVKAKHHLSSALMLANGTINSHTKPVILALLASLFVRTKTDEGTKMLVSAWTMVRGMGSSKPSTKGKDKEKAKAMADVIDESVVGNPRLGLTLGEQLLEAYKAEGNEAKVSKQKEYNAVHRKVLDKMEKTAC